MNTGSMTLFVRFNCQTQDFSMMADLLATAEKNQEGSPGLQLLQ